MPELPEVETVCQALKAAIEGQSFTSVYFNRRTLRYPLPLNLENEVKGHLISSVTRRAKYIFVNFNHGLTLIWHLGMSGRVIIESPQIPFLAEGAHDHVIFMTSHNYKITYRDPRRFGFLLLSPTNQLNTLSPFDKLGPEPLDDLRLNALAFHNRLKSRSISLKHALLDQRIIAGLGNIYVSEALWQAKLSPLRLASTLALTETEILLREIRDVLKRAIASGGSTLRDHIQPNGEIGNFQHCFKVYGRKGQLCNYCNVTSICKMVQNGRATYYCEKCQI